MIATALLAFGWNLLGAVLGGLLEFTAMAVGIKALTLLGLAAYRGAFSVAARGAAAEAVEKSRTR